MLGAAPECPSQASVARRTIASATDTQRPRRVATQIESAMSDRQSQQRYLPELRIEQHLARERARKDIFDRLVGDSCGGDGEPAEPRSN